MKRAYGNWGKETLKNWKEVLRNYAIKPIQQIDYVSGKNATDIALTIDAMDFLYNSEYDGFGYNYLCKKRVKRVNKWDR